MNRVFPPTRSASTLRLLALNSRRFLAPTACIGFGAAVLLNTPAQRTGLGLVSQGQAQLGEQQSRGYGSKVEVSPKVVKQLAQGSMTGFGVGLVVAFFSRTLAFFGGLLAVGSYVAARYGLDLPQMLGVKKLLSKSSFWQKRAGSPWFTASFALTFLLAAFVHL